MDNELIGPKVSIIILNWNGWRDTIECIESVYQNTYFNYNLIILDNGSNDGSIDYIKQYAKGDIVIKSKFFKFTLTNKPIGIIEYSKEEIEHGGKEAEINDLLLIKKLILIRSEINYGFAEGNNIAIRYALRMLNPDYLLLLNNDTVVDKDFLWELINSAEKAKDIGIVGALNYYYSEPNRIWYFGGKLNWITGYKFGSFNGSIDTGQLIDPFEVDEVAGSCMLIRKSLFKDIGFFYSKFFCYYEETDFCIRCKKNQFKVIANPRSKIWHKVGSSAKKITDFENHFLTRNRFIFMRRNLALERFILFFIYAMLIDLPLQSIYILFFKKNLRLLKNYYKSIGDGIYSIFFI